MKKKENEIKTNKKVNGIVMYSEDFDPFTIPSYVHDENNRTIVGANPDNYYNHILSEEMNSLQLMINKCGQEYEELTKCEDQVSAANFITNRTITITNLLRESLKYNFMNSVYSEVKLLSDSIEDMYDVEFPVELILHGYTNDSINNIEANYNVFSRSSCLYIDDSSLSIGSYLMNDVKDACMKTFNIISSNIRAAIYCINTQDLINKVGMDNDRFWLSIQNHITECMIRIEQSVSSAIASTIAIDKVAIPVYRKFKNENNLNCAYGYDEDNF